MKGTYEVVGKIRVEVEIEPEHAVFGRPSDPQFLAVRFFDFIMANEPTQKFFELYPEVSRVQFFQNDLIHLDCRRPEGVLEKTAKIVKVIEKKMEERR